MNRMRLYLVLALPVLAFAAYMALLPSSTRGTFITEFKHRTAALFGYDLAPPPEDRGLRLDHPEEYGLPPEVGDGTAEESAEATETEPANEQNAQ